MTAVAQSIGNVALLNTQNAAAAEQQHQVAGEINNNALAINGIANLSEPIPNA
ncbi:MAG: hypothetical protein V7752_00855 [Halopseudomonas sp.]